METCSKCELRDAERVCHECEEVFCEDCALFHPKIKAYRGHDLFKYEPRERANLDAKLCWNCEEQTAKFQCKDCPPKESHFCNGCSIVHPTVRAFKGHHVDVMMIPNKKHHKKHISMLKEDKGKKKGVRFDEETTRRDDTKGVSDKSITIEEYFEDDVTETDTVVRMFSWLGDVVDKYTRANDWQSRATVMLFTFLMYLLVKQLLGRVSVILLVALAYMTIRSTGRDTTKRGNDKDGKEFRGRNLWESLAEDTNAFLNDIGGLMTGSRKVQNSDELERVRKQLLELKQVPDDEDFRHEFWHTEKQPALRKRPIMKVEVRNR